MFQGLKKFSEKTINKVIAYLSQETKDYHMEEYMVRLAGTHRIEASIPYLFRIYNDSNFMDFVNSTCISSLGEIGTVQVANEIENQYNLENDSRDGLVSILGYIPYEFSEKLLIRFLKEEKDISIKTIICNSLCDIFSIEASGAIIDTIEKRQYDSSMNTLCDALIPVFEYHNKMYDFTLLESREAEYSMETLENDPIRKMLEPLQNRFRNFEIESKTKSDNNIIQHKDKELIQKAGRNDPCPCGSGKKFKKCCMLKKNDNSFK